MPPIVSHRFSQVASLVLVLLFQSFGLVSFLGWGLLTDVFACKFLGNLQGGGGFVVNAIKESVKYFLTFSAKIADD